jgi:hypothetical protein
MAYNLASGVMTSFAPVMNSQVRALAVSPDGSILYAGGDFTSVNGVNRYRLAAFSTATGALLPSFAPVLDYKVTALTATATTVFIGGGFNSVSGNARARLAAVNATTGALTSWNPGADAQVNALVVTPRGDMIIAGGAFQNVAGRPAYGLAALDATGALKSWAAGAKVRDAGKNAAILSLTSDGASIYGSGYVFGSGGNLEGAFSANPDTGAINWIEDCHGDTYSVYASQFAFYSVSHAHYCGNVGGFPQSDPWSVNSRHAIAFTRAATGTVGTDPFGGAYFNWGGNPSPSIMNWFPDMTTGTFTGQNQAAWSVSGNSQYVVLGGEFPTVNGVGQQGLARFAVSPPAPHLQGPRLSGASLVPTLASLASGSVRISFPADWDRDDVQLTYKVIKDSNSASPVYSTSVSSTYWNRPTITFTDVGLASGSSHKYRLQAIDPSGNSVFGDTVTITVQ